MSKCSPNTLHLENSEEAAIVVTTAHNYCTASSGHDECGAPDRRPSSQVYASQLGAANHWNVSRNVSYRVHCIMYRIISWARRIVSALLAWAVRKAINRMIWGVNKLFHVFYQSNPVENIQVIINSLRPSDDIWRQRTGSTLAQVMAWCLTAPSHYLNQCWLIITKVLWRSCEDNFTRDASAINYQN